jgi:hypothetical protein
MRTFAMVLLGLFLSLGALGLWLFMHGTIIVHDPSGRAAEVSVVSASGTRPLHRLPWGYFVGMAEEDGTLMGTCADRRTFNLGYVTAGLTTNERMESPRAC